jgi:hypothetical protein
LNRVVQFRRDLFGVRDGPGDFGSGELPETLSQAVNGDLGGSGGDAQTHGRVGRRRGGSWYDDGGFCRSAFRLKYDPGYRNLARGFRVVQVRSGAR